MAPEGWPSSVSKKENYLQHLWLLSGLKDRRPISPPLCISWVEFIELGKEPRVLEGSNKNSSDLLHFFSKIGSVCIKEYRQMDQSHDCSPSMESWQEQQVMYAAASVVRCEWISDRIMNGIFPI